MTTTTITILPSKKTIDIQEGETILSALRRQLPDAAPAAPCGGKGTCGKCRVIVNGGSITAPTATERSFLTPEDLSEGVRLACHAAAIAPMSPLTVALTNAGTEHKILKSGMMPAYELNPVVTQRRFNSVLTGENNNVAPHPTLHTLFQKTTNIHIPDQDISLLRQLAQTQDTGPCDVVFFRDTPISICTARKYARRCAIAVDIGTTTVACTLIELETGSTLSQGAQINPQTAYGADVLSRIEYTMQQACGLEALQALIIGCLDSLTAQLASDAGIDTSDIIAYAVAANTTMLHLLLGVPPKSLALAPYYPVFTDDKIVNAQSLGLRNCARDTVLCCLPSISSYIGADILAGIAVSGIADSEDNALLIDIGTNGEIVLSRRGRLSACACAAGPALEGMNISCGMRAATGAIEQIQVHDDGFHSQTIGGAAPTGICGSGVLDIMAELLRHGAVDTSGRIADPLPALFHRYTRPNGKTPAFILSGGGDHLVEFTQSDIRQVQLAKGAILSGITALLQSASLSAEKIDRVLIAGQFGAHLSEASLLNTGILPKTFEGKIQYIGNSSLSGAMLFLLDRSAGIKMRQLAETVAYLELATYPGYTRLLMDCMKFPAVQGSLI